MNPSSLRLKARVALTHYLVGAAGVLTFLLVGALLAYLMPTPSPDHTPTHVLLIVLLAALVAALISALAAFALSKWLTYSIVAPLRQLIILCRRLARGHYTEVVSRTVQIGPADDEIGEVTGAFKELASALEAAERRRILSFGEVAHEIRTPVAVLEGYLEGLLDGHVKPSAKTWAMLHDEASRVHRLVDELQVLSRAEAQQEPPDLVAVDPEEIARAALDRLSLHFSTKGLELIADIQKGLPLVMADPDQALQALVNLLTNALRYTPVPGTVTLSVERLQGTNEVVFRVTDTGVGIAAEHVPHLFERFFRVDRASSRSVGGSGIGLPVAKALVEAMGGRIWAESPGLGKGSTFSFTLLISANQRPG